MDLKELKNALIEETNADAENISIKNKFGKPYIFIDDFEIHPTKDEDIYSVSDSRGELTSFSAIGEDVLDFFKGFFDAYVYDDKQEEENEYYDKGFEFSVECMGEEIESEETDEDDEDEEESEEDTDDLEDEEEIDEDSDDEDEEDLEDEDESDRP